MVKAVNEQDETALEWDQDPEVEVDTLLSDGALLDLLDALVEARGRVPAAGVLGVNYRTLALCCDSRQVSLRMRQALVDFRNAGGSVAARRRMAATAVRPTAMWRRCGSGWSNWRKRI